MNSDQPSTRSIKKFYPYKNKAIAKPDEHPTLPPIHGFVSKESKYEKLK